MDERRRLRYLAAMGVTHWQRPEVLAQGNVLASASVEPSSIAPSEGADREHTGNEDLCSAAQAPVDNPGGAPAPAGVPSAVNSASPPDRPTPAAVESLDWPALEARVKGCRACALCETRTQAVFGVGDTNADLMMVGEAPGADEDRQGEPFVGRAGQLLTAMLAAIGLERSQVYIANILKCRPPGNRDPHVEEALQCIPYLKRQIALLRPRVMLAVGRISAQKLLDTDTAIGRLRGRWYQYGPERVPLRVTYHPAYLLRSPDQKAKTWSDLIEVARRLRSN